MKKMQPPRDIVEALGESYELLLESALKKAHQSGSALHHVIEEVRNEVAAMKNFSAEEAVKLEKYLLRDLSDAAQFTGKTGKALEDWLGFDADMIKRDLWQQFSKAADHTTLALNQLRLEASDAEYHTGEAAGLGTLICDKCGEKMHFYMPDIITECRKCKGTHFHRQKIS
jgi:hypothetical protein